MPVDWAAAGCYTIDSYPARIPPSLVPWKKVTAVSEFDSVASTSDCDPIETIGAAGSFLLSALSQAMTRHEQT